MSVKLPKYIYEGSFNQGKIEKAFWLFHRKNPEVYTDLIIMIEQLKKRGHKSYSMAGLFVVLRWRRDTKTVGSIFKYNNNLGACYSRLIMQNIPEYEGFFKIRKTSKHITEDPEVEKF